MRSAHKWNYLYKYSIKNYQQNENSLYILEDEMDIPENMDSHCWKISNKKYKKKCIKIAEDEMDIPEKIDSHCPVITLGIESEEVNWFSK